MLVLLGHMNRFQPTGDPKRILIVDDNKMGLSARRSVLEAVGHTVATSQSGVEALEIFRSGVTFDLLVTDYKMPQLTGVELIAEVRQMYPAMPIILVSGFTDTLGLNEANTKADAVLQKCANEVAILMRTVAKLLTRTQRKPPGVSKGQGVAVKKRGVS